MAFFILNLLLKAYWACFCENLVILGLFFRIGHHAFLFNFLADFLFCCIFLPTHVGLVFRSNYLFFACFSYFIGVFFAKKLASLNATQSKARVCNSS